MAQKKKRTLLFIHHTSSTHRPLSTVHRYFLLSIMSLGGRKRISWVSGKERRRTKLSRKRKSHQPGLCCCLCGPPLSLDKETYKASEECNILAYPLPPPFLRILLYLSSISFCFFLPALSSLCIVKKDTSTTHYILLAQSSPPRCQHSHPH